MNKSPLLSAGKTVPTLIWSLQTSPWQKKQSKTWRSTARCGVCMRSGSKVSLRRPRKTGSHSGLSVNIDPWDFSVILELYHCCVSWCEPMCPFFVCLLVHCRSKTYVFEEFLFTWQERLRKLEQPTALSVKLQAEVDKYKVFNYTFTEVSFSPRNSILTLLKYYKSFNLCVQKFEFFLAE